MDNYLFQNRWFLAEKYFDITEWARHNNIAYFPGVDAPFFLWATSKGRLATDIRDSIL
jgi:hypothetical protein